MKYRISLHSPCTAGIMSALFFSTAGYIGAKAQTPVTQTDSVTTQIADTAVVFFGIDATGSGGGLKRYTGIYEKDQQLL